MTIKQAVDLGIAELRAAHTHDPKGCAKFLLRHVLGDDPNKILLTDPKQALSDEQEKKYRDMLLRRKLHEPVWYITNEAYFWKDPFFVDERVLIPRPETEILVEKALEYIHSSPAKKKLSVIDVGTGSGEIAVSLYKEMKLLGKVVQFFASDISKDAIDVAKENAKRLDASKIKFVVGDALDPFSEKVDLIIGNPPYVPTDVVGGLAYDIHHFEPRVALDGGTDGLDVHRKILKKARKLIRSGGAVLLEIGHDQGKLATTIAAEHFPAAKIQIIKDYDGNDRILELFT